MRRRRVIEIYGDQITDTAGIVGPTPDGAEPIQYPSTARQVANATTAKTKWYAAGSPKRTAEEVAELRVICEACPSGAYDAEQDRCRACGCPLKSRTVWEGKLAMATESCPRGHW